MAFVNSESAKSGMSRRRLPVLSACLSLLLCPAVWAAEKTPAPKPRSPMTLNDLRVAPPSSATPQAKAYSFYCKAAMAKMRGDLKTAVEMLEEALKHDPKAIVVHEELAELYGKLGDQKRYFDHVKRLVEIAPSSFIGHWSLGLYYSIVGKPKEAIAELEKATKCAVDDPMQINMAWLKLADLYREQKDPKKAIAVCEQMLKDKAQIRVGIAHRANLIMGQAYAELKDHDQAVTRFKNCIALDVQGRDPATLVAYQGLTEVYIAQKKFDDAISLLTAAAKLTPENFEFLRLLGVAYDKAGRTNEGIIAYKNIAAASPQNAGALYLLAVLYERDGKISEAIETYDKLLAPKASVPENIRLLSFVNLSNIHARRKRYDEAIGVMAKAVAMVPPENLKAKAAQDLFLHLVYLYDQAGRAGEAEGLLLKMLSADPNNPQANNYLGYFYADRGVNLERSVELINRALKAEPENGAYLDSLGWALFKLAKAQDPAASKKGADAPPTLQQALDKLLYAAERNKKEEGGEDPVILDHIAIVYFCLGEWEKAKAAWEASLARAQELAKERPNALPNKEQVQKMLTWVANRLVEEQQSHSLRLPVSERTKAPDK